MSAQLWADPAHLRAVAPKFDQLAQRMGEVSADLQGVIDSEGECWGADETGQTFAGGYLPSAETGTSALPVAVEVLSSLATKLRTTADSFESTDQRSASSLEGLF